MLLKGVTLKNPYNAQRFLPAVRYFKYQNAQEENIVPIKIHIPWVYYIQLLF